MVYSLGANLTTFLVSVFDDACFGLQGDEDTASDSGQRPLDTPERSSDPAQLQGPYMSLPAAGSYHNIDRMPTDLEVACTQSETLSTEVRRDQQLGREVNGASHTL